jgi:hypothetical protein
MARTNSNALLKGFSGAIGKQIVVKQYGDKTVISKYPDMSGVKASPNQKKRRSVFHDGVAYAKAIVRNPAKKAAYAKKLAKGQRVFQAAMSEYMHEHIKVGGVKGKAKGRK